ncbi:MAG: glycosyltransferase family 4 protein [Polyangiaceae bacterium]
MRIAYLSDERFPSTHTDTQQVALTLDALHAQGAEVELIAPTMPGLVDQDQAMQHFYGVGPLPTRWLRSVDPERRGLVKLLHGGRALAYLSSRRPDVVLTRGLHLALAALAAGHRVAFESYRVAGRAHPRLTWLVARAAQTPRLLGVITHSRLSARAFLRLGLPEERVAVIKNGVAFRHLEPRLDVAQARAQLGLAGPLVVYAGHVMPNKGLEALAEVAALTPELHHLWVGGDGEGSAGWGRALCRDLPQVRVTGWRRAPELAPYLYAADALVVPPSRDPLERHGNTVLPMKLYGYLGSGRPIVAPALPDIAELLCHDDTAWLFPPDDTRAAARALRRVVADEALGRRLGEAGLALARQHTWTARAGALLEFLEERLEATR